MYCRAEATRKFGMRVDVCEEHYKDFIDEQKAWYNGDISEEERFMMIRAKKRKLYK